MLKELTEEMKEAVQAAIDAECRISYGNPIEYNALVCDCSYSTAVSASGRVYQGSEAVKNASIEVSKGNIGERERTLELISCDYSDDLSIFYCVFITSVVIEKSDGSENILKWVITLVMKRENDHWAIVHRQNTRC